MNPNRIAILVALVCGHLLLSALLPPVMDLLGPPDSFMAAVVFSLMGVVASQVNLIAMWAVFAPGAVAWRLPWALLLGIIMWCTITISNRVMWDFPRREALIVGGIFLGGILVAQIPLWILRAFMRYRLYPPGQRREAEEQFNMRQLLIGIALCCVGLALMQAVLPPASDANAFFGPPIWEILIMLSVVGTVNLLLTLPCLWFALTSSPRAIPAWCAAFFFYALAITVGEAVVITFVTRGPTRPEEFVGLGFFNMMQGASIGVTLGILRAIGFTWERRSADLIEAEVAAPKLVAEPGPYVHPLDAP